MNEVKFKEVLLIDVIVMLYIFINFFFLLTNFVGIMEPKKYAFTLIEIKNKYKFAHSFVLVDV